MGLMPGQILHPHLVQNDIQQRTLSTIERHAVRLIYQSFTLRATVEPIGQFGWNVKQEFNTILCYAPQRLSTDFKIYFSDS